MMNIKYKKIEWDEYKKVPQSVFVEPILVDNKMAAITTISTPKSNEKNVWQELFEKEKLEEIEKTVKIGDPGVLISDNKEKLTNDTKTFLKNYWKNMYSTEDINAMLGSTAIPTSIFNSINSNSYIEAKNSQDVYASSLQKEFMNEYLQDLSSYEKNKYNQFNIVCLLEVLKAWNFIIDFVLSQYNCKNKKYILEIKQQINLYMQQLNNPTNAMNVTNNINVFIRSLREHLDYLLNKNEEKLNCSDDKISFNLDLD
jgi:hypothetical protein